MDPPSTRKSRISNLPMSSPMRLAVLNIVGLSESLLGPHTPFLSKFAETQGRQSYAPEFPAVTCTAQSSLVTGAPVSEHGIVANGWYDRESAEVRFWKQSNHLVRGEKLWDKLRREIPGFTCAKLFWWLQHALQRGFLHHPAPALSGGRPQGLRRPHPADVHARGPQARPRRLPLPLLLGTGRGHRLVRVDRRLRQMGGGEITRPPSASSICRTSTTRSRRTDPTRLTSPPSSPPSTASPGI
jgi:hypothetical protein